MTPFVIGIAGGSASGKTTVARRLVELLGDQAVVIHHDRYYFSLPEALRETPLAYNFDHPDALDTDRLVRDLDVLREGKGTHVPAYQFVGHRRTDAEDWLDPCPIVIVEGILVLADSRLRERFDVSLYVHTPADVRLMRRVRRDIDQRGREAHQVLDQYERTVRPMHTAYVAPSRVFADHELDGTSEIEGLVAQVRALLPEVART